MRLQRPARGYSPLMANDERTSIPQVPIGGFRVAPERSCGWLWWRLTERRYLGKCEFVCTAMPVRRIRFASSGRAGRPYEFDVDLVASGAHALIAVTLMHDPMMQGSSVSRIGLMDHNRKPITTPGVPAGFASGNAPSSCAHDLWWSSEDLHQLANAAGLEFHHIARDPADLGEFAPFFQERRTPLLPQTYLVRLTILAVIFGLLGVALSFVLPAAVLALPAAIAALTAIMITRYRLGIGSLEKP